MDKFFNEQIKKQEKGVATKEYINFLFDQCPQLASAVYESLGFKSKIQLTDDENRSKRKIDLSHPVIFLDKILIDGNNRVRYAHKNNLAVKRIDLLSYEDIKNNLSYLEKLDVGTVKKVISYYEEWEEQDKREFIGETFLDEEGNEYKEWSPKAMISRSNYAEMSPERFEEYKKDYFDRLVYLVGSDKKELEELNVINVNSQQEQQAKELYSQYLNTVFPANEQIIPNSDKFEMLNSDVYIQKFKEFVKNYKNSAPQ